MGKILIVAEKPSVARDIARVLGVTTRGEGFISSEKYVVTWAIGHLVSLKEPEELDERLKRWRAADLPILPEKMELKVLPKTRSQFSVIKKLMNSKETDSLICATDSGREGELIFRYIYDMAVCKKPFERLWISSMTDEAIRMGFDTLKPGSHYDALYESARCRSEADWLVGMNASRAFTLRYQALLSVGRVQTPTLQMLVKRRKEIDSFLSEPFYTVQADFGDYQGTWFDPSKDGDKRITEETKAKAIAEKVKGQKAIVQSAQSEEKRELPPQLYDLTTLQREASSMLGFTADKTLKTAQALYEKHKLITYPRTDSRYLSHDMGPSVKKALQSLGEPYAALAAPVLSQPIPQPKRIFDDTKLTDHHAIIPTGRRVNSDTLSEDERKLFDLVARRLIAAFYRPISTMPQRLLRKVWGRALYPTVPSSFRKASSRFTVICSRKRKGRIQKKRRYHRWAKGRNGPFVRRLSRRIRQNRLKSTQMLHSCPKWSTPGAESRTRPFGSR